MTYGEAPTDLGRFDLGWDEFMRYLYCPVVIPDWDRVGPGRGPRVAIPPNLEFASGAVDAAISDYLAGAHDWPVTPWEDLYVYVTTSRGFATPDNPLNRPGWHCDGFGSDDLNYVWFDTCPTRFAIQDFVGIDPDHVQSMAQMAQQVTTSGTVADLPTAHLYRLTPHTVHATPTIPAPGRVRGFMKISVSAHRYNLLGNTHNHDLPYAWRMYDRATLRNDPHRGETDFVIEGRNER